MTKVLQGAKDTLVQLDQLIHQKLTRRDSTSANLKVSRYEWVKAKSTIENYRECLRNIRLNIIAQMTILNT